MDINMDLPSTGTGTPMFPPATGMSSDTSSDTETTPTAMDREDTPASLSLGALLAKVRVAKGLEQREVASQLGLSLVLIKNLEEDAFQQLGAPIFVRGYLSRYARLLGLPEQEILSRYKQLGISELPPLRVEGSIKPQAKISDRGVRWFSYLLVLAVLGWLGVQQVVTHFESSTNASPSVTPLLTTPVAPAPPTPSTPAISSNTVTEPVAIAQPAPVAPPGTPEAPSQEVGIPPADNQVSVQRADNSALPAASNADLSPTASIPTGEPQLVLEFTENVWVNVKDANGKRLAYGTMKANTMSTLSGPAPFSLILGNSGATRIKLNDQAIDPATYVKRGGVSRFVLNVPKPGE